MVVLFSLVTFFLPQIFLQMVKMIFSGHFPKDKDDAAFSKNVLLKQEKVELDSF